MGSGANGELTFIDLISLVSFIVGLENLELNITQEDVEKQTAEIDKRVNDQLKQALLELHMHLEQQDDKIDRLLELYNGNNERTV